MMIVMIFSTRLVRVRTKRLYSARLESGPIAPYGFGVPSHVRLRVSNAPSGLRWLM